MQELRINLYKLTIIKKHLRALAAVRAVTVGTLARHIASWGKKMVFCLRGLNVIALLCYISKLCNLVWIYRDAWRRREREGCASCWWWGPQGHERSTRLPRNVRRNLNNGGLGLLSSSHVYFISLLYKTTQITAYTRILRYEDMPSPLTLNFSTHELARLLIILSTKSSLICSI